MRPHKSALNAVAAAQPRFSTLQFHHATQQQNSGTVLQSGATVLQSQQHHLYSQTLNSQTMSLFHHFMNHSMSSAKCSLSILILNKLTMLEPRTISTCHSPAKLALITLALAFSLALSFNTLTHQKVNYPLLQFLKHPNFNLTAQMLLSLAYTPKLVA